jgi:outer membrane protein
MKSLTRFALVLWTAASLIVSPIYAQAAAAPQNQQQGQQQTTPTPALVPDISEQAAAPQAGPPAPITQKKLRLGPDYSHGKPWFPNIFDQYWPTSVPPPELTNTPKIDQLIQNSQLKLSLDDAIALALENNLDIRVQRYTTWISQTQVLKAESGGIPEATSAQAVVLGAAPLVSFDPSVTVQASWDQSTTPVNNAFTTGAGTTSIPASSFHENDYKLTYTEGFHTGTSFTLTWDNPRYSSNFTDYVFNPWVQPQLTAEITQPLLNGCCIFPATRFIVIAKNDMQMANAGFRTSVIADISQTSIDYWELVYDRQFVKVEQQAVSVSQKLYEDNKKQLQIGTMAPLDVLTAQSQLASDKQALVLAQGNELLGQTKLLNDITKNPLAPNLKEVEIVPTTQIEAPEPVNTPIDQLMAEAWQNVPQMTLDRLSLENDKISLKATVNALKPSLNLFLEYQATGIAGIATSTTASTIGFVADPTLPVVDASGTQTSPPLFLGSPVFGPSATTMTASGIGPAEHDMISAKYPTYIAGITLGLPLRNRSAQADNANALLSERQMQTQYQKDRNTVYINVRSSLIALEQDRAAVAAAAEATRLAQQTLIDEQKKYQLGSSTSYLVVQRARDLTQAQGIELRDRINLVEAQVSFDQSMGRTLQTNNITLADALRGKITTTPNIPGTPDTDAGLAPAPRNPWTESTNKK